MLPICREAQSGQQSAKMSNDRLFINSELQRQYLPPLLPESLSGHEAASFPEVRASLPKSSNKGKLQVFIAECQNSQDARNTLDAVLLSYPSIPRADHLVYAYIADGRENFDSDGTSGMGLNLLKKMRDYHLHNSIAFIAIWGTGRAQPSVGVYDKLLQVALDEVITTYDSTSHSET